MVKELVEFSDKKFVVLVKSYLKSKAILAVVNFLKSNQIPFEDIYVSGIIDGYEVKDLLAKDRVPQFPFTRSMADQTTCNLYDALTPNELSIHEDVMRLHPAANRDTCTEYMDHFLSRFEEMVAERQSKEYLLLPELFVKLGDARSLFIKAYSTYNEEEDDQLPLWVKVLIELNLVNKSDLSPTHLCLDIVDAYRHSKALPSGGSEFQEIYYNVVAIYVLAAGRWHLGDMIDKNIAIQANILLGIIFNTWIANEFHPDMADEEMMAAETMVSFNT